MSTLAEHFNHCDIGPLANFSNFENRTKFSQDEFSLYVHQYINFRCHHLVTTTRIGLISFIISGAVGFISYILMWATLGRLSISDCTLIYHRATVLLEFPHMLVMMQYGTTMLCLDHVDEGAWSWQFWNHQFAQGWRIGDAIKLAVTTISAFLSFERCVAVCFLRFFPNVNHKQFAYSALICSIFIGTAHLWQILTVKVIYNEKFKIYTTRPTWFRTNNFMKFIIYFIFSAKAGLSGLIFILSVATAVGMEIQKRKISFMNVQTRNDLRAKRKACALSYILGASVLIDHTVWLIHKITRGRYVNIGPTLVITNLTYEQARLDLNEKRLLSFTELFTRLTGQWVHSWRFVIYLILNQTMRNGVRKVFLTNHGQMVSQTKSGNLSSCK